jgi:hypothetical protein
MSCRIHRERYSLSQSSSMHGSQIRRSASPENGALSQSQYNRDSSPDLIQTANVYSAIQSMLDQRVDHVRDGTDSLERPRKRM